MDSKTIAIGNTIDSASHHNNNNQTTDCMKNTLLSMPATTNINDNQFANLGGVTQTTATLTPTTLKNIEESFMEIIPPQSRPHPQEARFVPPLVNISSSYSALHSNYIHNNNNNNNNVNNDMNTSSTNSNSNASDLDMGSDYDTDEDSSRSEMQWNAYVDRDNAMGNDYHKQTNKTAEPKARAKSGRKPMRNDKLTPEEERKRHQRRERNKQAAARCRKRRMDHTNVLMEETDGLEDKRQSLLNEVEALRKQKEELEIILETHKTQNCKMNSNKIQNIDIKPMVSNGSVISMNSNSAKLRPNTLSLTSCTYSTDNLSDSGIPIQTPSTGLFLEALAEGGTGLTPVLTPSVITPSSVSSNSYNSRHKLSPNSDSHKKLITL